MLGWGWDPLKVSEAERDAGFREEVRRLARQGLSVIAAVEVIVPVLLLLAQFAVLPDRSTWAPRTANTLAVVVVGLLTLLTAKAKLLAGRERLIGSLSGWTVGAILITFSLLLASQGTAAAHYIPGQITTVLLVGVGALPLRPLQTLGLGLAMWAYYIVAGWATMGLGIVETVDPDGTQGVFILMSTLLSAALSGLLYSERVSNYRSHQEALRTSETLCKTQSRLLLSENAASLGRLTAALSHELNNPVGALRSAVDTLLLLAAKQSASPPREQQRLVPLQADLRRSIADSSDRLHEIVARLQRFTNLDKAEVQPADLPTMIRDVAALLEPEISERAELELDLEPMAPLVCRPQQLSAVLANLLRNAVEAIQNGNGRIRIAAHELDSQVELQIHDNGRGLRPEELATIFDPGFRVSGKRVGTGNWSLFSARQIVREHGGEISIESPEGEGTLVSVRLPRLPESELD